MVVHKFHSPYRFYWVMSSPKVKEVRCEVSS